MRDDIPFTCKYSGVSKQHTKIPGSKDTDVIGLKMWLSSFRQSPLQLIGLSSLLCGFVGIMVLCLLFLLSPSCAHAGDAGHWVEVRE